MLMRRLGGAAAVLVLGLSVSARAGDTAAPSSSGGGFWSRLNPFGGKKETTPEIPPTIPVPPGAVRGSTASQGPAVELPAETEDDAYIRRVDVIDRVRALTPLTNVELLRKLDVLEQRSLKLMMARTGPQRGTPFESEEGQLSTGRNGRRDLMPAERPRTDSRGANLREDPR